MMMISVAHRIERFCRAGVVVGLGGLPGVIASSAAAAGWEAGGVLPAPKQHAFGVVHGGVVYAIGGTPWVNGGDQDGTVHRLVGGSWSAAAPMDGTGPTIPMGGGVDGLGRIVFFGGIAINNGDTGKNAVYDPVEGPTDDIADPSDLVQQLGFAFATDDLGRLYWLGGGNGASGGNSAHGERYDAGADAWTAIANLPGAVADGCACFDGAGHVLVFGGFGASGVRSADVKRYEIATNSWSSTAVPDMPFAVSGARSVLGADQRVYVMGGVGMDGAVQSTVQVLNLATNTWSTAPSLATARHQFAAALGEDDFIYVIGGTDAQGAALDSVERLFTPTCPTLPEVPSAIAVWQGQTANVDSGVTGGAPMEYAWFRDDVPLEDGPTGTGSTLSGTDSATLAITLVGPADAGIYSVAATNGCGTADGAVAALEIRVPPAIPTNWTVTSLHPAWATSSSALCVDDVRQGGTATLDLPEYPGMSRAVRWSGTAASAEDLTPPNSVGSAVSSMHGDTLAGWWWWPYQCQVGGQWYTCHSKQAARWTGDPVTFTNLQYSGWEYSAASDVRDGVVGGTVTSDDAVDNVWSHAVAWGLGGFTVVDLHPAGASSSFIAAVDGGTQHGSILTPYPAPKSHAAQWSGSAQSFVDLHPFGAVVSQVIDADEGLAAGTTGYFAESQACVWTRSGESWRSLHPAGAARSDVRACRAGLVLGSVTAGGTTSLVIWRGAAAEYEVLVLPLPADFASADVKAFDVAEDGTFSLVGSGYNQAMSRTEALLWTSMRASLPGDLDGDGAVTGADLGLLLAAWGTVGPGDIDGDGVVDGADLGVLLGAWTG